MMSPSSQIPRPANESRFYNASDLRRVIARLGFAFSNVRGVSMRPLIWMGNHYVAIRQLQGRVKVGDILAFEQIRKEDTAYIIHRLVAIEENDGANVYVMRGDNCIGCERIREQDIIGIATDFYRIGGWRPWHAIPKSHFTPSDKCCLLYKKIWMKSWPLRRNIYRLRATLSKIKHRIG